MSCMQMEREVLLISGKSCWPTASMAKFLVILKEDGDVIFLSI